MSSRRPVSRLPSLQRRLSEDSPWEKRLPQPRVSERTGSGAKFLKSAGTGSHMHAAFTAAPAPHNRRRVSCKPFGKCSEMFGIRGGLPHPSPGLWFPVKYSEMFGNVRKWWGAPSPTPPPGRWVRLKCSEMFGYGRTYGGGGGAPHHSPGLWFPVKCSEMLGNVRKWGAPSPTPPPGRWVPLKCSEMFGNVRN